MHKGSCHCGRIAFQVDAEPTRVMDCNCSLCARRGALLWFVPRDRLRLLTPAADLSTYRFGEGTIQHRFCSVCGIHTFGEARDADGTPMAAINARCLEDIDVSALPVDRFDGRSL
jgi:hypothetical protein